MIIPALLPYTTSKLSRRFRWSNAMTMPALTQPLMSSPSVLSAILKSSLSWVWNWMCDVHTEIEGTHSSIESPSLVESNLCENSEARERMIIVRKQTVIWTTTINRCEFTFNNTTRKITLCQAYLTA